jgi:tetratricopeptide (TPR) repeat protein
MNTSLPPPPTPAPSPGPLKRVLRAGIAVPLAILRHPLRALSIAALLLLIGAGAGIAGVWLWASHHLRLGRQAVERYHTAEAVPHLEAVLKVWPRDPETLLLAARTARRSGAHDQAEYFLDLYQEQRKEDDNLTVERVCLRSERGDPDSVFPYCRAQIDANDPSAPLLFESLAIGYINAYQPYKALTVTRRWIEQEPDTPQAHLIQGRALDLGERKYDAIKSFRAALEVDPTLHEARERLCDVLMNLGALEEASPHLEYLSACFPNDAKIQVYLARIQENSGNTQEAERILEAVLARQPNHAGALLERAKQLMRVHNYVEAEKMLREAVKYEPSNLQARDRLAISLEQNGKPAEADKEREQIKQMEKDTRDIQEILSGLMEKQPQSAELHYKLGMIALRAGVIKEALRWLNSALKQDPHHQGAHKALMEYYHSIGDFDREREHRQHLIDFKDKAAPPP